MCANKQGFQVKPRIRRMVSFAQMNLAESPYIGKIDCIFCMNVLMYFSTGAAALPFCMLFHDALEPGGYFLLGHSETLSDVSSWILSRWFRAIAGFIASRFGAESRRRCCSGGGEVMNPPNQQAVEAVPAGILRAPPISCGNIRACCRSLRRSPEDLEKLYISSHTLAGTSASYGYPHFSEVAAKMAHIFHYAMNAIAWSRYAAAPHGIHLPMQSPCSNSTYCKSAPVVLKQSDDIATFKQRYAFAFPAAPNRPNPKRSSACAGALQLTRPASEQRFGFLLRGQLPEDAEFPAEVLEFFIPEAEEHLQTVTECLLVLEAHPNSEEINRLFRSMHTIKGSAAQVGLHRLIGRSAPRGRLDRPACAMDGLQPSAKSSTFVCNRSISLKSFCTGCGRATRRWLRPLDPLARAHRRAMLLRESRNKRKTRRTKIKGFGGDTLSAEDSPLRSLGKNRRSLCRKRSPCGSRLTGSTA